MFGNDNKNKNVQSNDNQAPAADTTAPPVSDMTTFSMNPPLIHKGFGPSNPIDTPPPTDMPAVDGSAPVTDEPVTSAPLSPGTANEDEDLAGEDSADNSADNTPANKNDNELIDIKQQALTQLSPIISHLDQSPEEKFRTLMMMIQASDNQALIKEAYQAAEQITDEKAKAQALLDIVNEINYFTQPKDSQTD